MEISLNRQDGEATMEERDKNPARLIEHAFRLKQAFLQSVPKWDTRATYYVLNDRHEAP